MSADLDGTTEVRPAAPRRTGPAGRRRPAVVIAGAAVVLAATVWAGLSLLAPQDPPAAPQVQPTFDGIFGERTPGASLPATTAAPPSSAAVDPSASASAGPSSTVGPTATATGTPVEPGVPALTVAAKVIKRDLAQFTVQVEVVNPADKPQTWKSVKVDFTGLNLLIGGSSSGVIHKGNGCFVPRPPIATVPADGGVGFTFTVTGISNLKGVALNAC